MSEGQLISRSSAARSDSRGEARCSQIVCPLHHTLQLLPQNHGHNLRHRIEQHARPCPARFEQEEVQKVDDLSSEITSELREASVLGLELTAEPAIPTRIVLMVAALAAAVRFAFPLACRVSGQ